MKKVLFIYMLFFSAFLFSQDKEVGKVSIYGRVETKNKVLDNYKIIVLKNNVQVLDTLITDGEGYLLSLELDGVYSVSFEKEGYLPKSIIFNGLLKGIVSDRKLTYQMDMEMIKLPKSYKDQYLILPIAKVYYDTRLKDFDYDKPYTEEVQKLYEEKYSKSH